MDNKENMEIKEEDNESATKKEKIKHGIKIALTVVASFVVGLLINKALTNDESTENSEDELPDDSEDESEYPKDEKYWNKTTDNWEKNGKPYKYRFSYFDERDGERHVEEYSDIDNGYEAYEYIKKKALWASDVSEWEHVEPEDD